jgi:transposase
LFAAGVHQAEVARQLEVSAQAVSVWHARWKEGGTEGLHSRGPSGPAPRLSDAQLAQVERALLDGATAHGFVGELWTLDRAATVIERLTGVHHHPAWVWALLRYRLGWSVQRPRRRAAERDQAAGTQRSLAGGRAAVRLCARTQPGRGLWSSLKAVELANLATPTLAEVIDQAHKGIERVRRTPHLAYSFLRHAGLSVT